MRETLHERQARLAAESECAIESAVSDVLDLARREYLSDGYSDLVAVTSAHEELYLRLQNERPWATDELAALDAALEIAQERAGELRERGAA